MTTIKADWPAPKNIHACITTRENGFSHTPYDSSNLGEHVGDKIEHVLQNREALQAQLKLTQQPLWLEQTHSTLITDFDGQNTQADACYSNQAHQVCAVMTADCLPLLVCNKDGTEIAAIHAGWRGLVDGVIENSINRFTSTMDQLLVWLGPCISKTHFEVGDDVLTAFMNFDKNSEMHFQKKDNGKYLCDMLNIARQRLMKIGVNNIYASDYCTYANESLFFSYRRDNITGRMASLIWRD